MVLHMDSLKSTYPLWVSLAESFRVDPRDIAQFSRRAECEGPQFVLDELTQLGRSFMHTVTTGEAFIVKGRFRTQKGTQLPRFLYTLFSKVLSDEGHLWAHLDPRYIKQIRQLTLLYYKLEIPHEQYTVDKAVEAFIKRDLELGDSFAIDQCETETNFSREVVLRRAKVILWDVLGQQANMDTFRPRHGSGATACRTPNHTKYHSFRYINKLSKAFDLAEIMFFNSTHLCDNLDDYLTWEECEEPCARLTCVPKDRRGPRLICMEPREQMFVQQGLMHKLYDIVESHELTSGFVNFRNQGINRDLARSSSVSQDLATLDLKDASDRVRWDLVQAIFPDGWVTQLDACRTDFVQLPGRETPYGPMRKFAPMGSAVCFPIEALTFWALLKSVMDVDVYVYGDDIILPIDKVDLAIRTLERFDLLVNVEKSCYITPFRESCGADFYDGFDVSYVKLRSLPHRPAKLSSDKWSDNEVSAEVSYVEFANHILEHYGERTFLGIRDCVDHIYGPHFCTVNPASLTYNCEPRCSNQALFKRRWNTVLQREEWNIPTSESRKRQYNRPAWGEVYRRSLEGWHTNIFDELFEQDEDCSSNPVELTSQQGLYAVPGCTRKFRWKTV